MNQEYEAFLRRQCFDALGKFGDRKVSLTIYRKASTNGWMRLLGADGGPKGRVVGSRTKSSTYVEFDAKELLAWLDEQRKK